jgi:Serine dehydrogenase proteinase
MARRKRRPGTANLIIEEQLDSHAHVVEELVGGDLLAFTGPIEQGIDDLIRDIIESRCEGRKTRKPKLAVILETPGGFIEVTQRIVHTLRSHYRQVDFIIPNFAMSAGTVLSLSGDNIYMDYYSVLGPIDPQIKQNGRWLPALGYLVQFERLIGKSQAGELSTAELAYFIEHFDPAELYSYEQARELSITLLKEWLVKYKFKSWLVTKTKKKKVTKGMKEARARHIAETLNKTQLWHSHGHGISMQVLKTRVGLLIEDFGQYEELNSAIRIYYKLLKDYMNRTGQSGVLHVVGKYIPLFFRE